jgi:hypothetical protein
MQAYLKFSQVLMYMFDIYQTPYLGSFLRNGWDSVDMLVKDTEAMAVGVVAGVLLPDGRAKFLIAGGSATAYRMYQGGTWSDSGMAGLKAATASYLAPKLFSCTLNTGLQVIETGIAVVTDPIGAVSSVAAVVA